MNIGGHPAFDATSVPLPDLSDAVNAQIGEVTGLDVVVAIWRCMMPATLMA